MSDIWLMPRSLYRKLRVMAGLPAKPRCYTRAVHRAYRKVRRG